MKKLFTLPSFYVLLWVLYYTQGTFFAQGGIISRVVLVLFLAISLYFAFIAYTKYHVGHYIKALGVLLTMFTVYGIAGIIGGVSFDYLKLIYLSLLPTFPFYVWTKQGKISLQWVRFVFFLFVGVIFAQYLSSIRYIEQRYTETENAVINVAYEVLALIPLLFFWRRKPLVQYLVLAIIMATVLSTVKRGAIIVGSLCLLYFIYSTTQESSKQMKWYIWLLVIAFIVIGVRYAINYFENNTYAQLRLDQTLEGNSSGRDKIYTKALNIFKNSNLISMLFGHGAWATLRSMKVLAHNDWLEILVNQGFLGVIIYLYYWVAFYKTFKRDKNRFTHPIIGMVMIIYFPATLFSMSYAAMTLPANLAIGYSMAAKNMDINIC